MVLGTINAVLSPIVKGTHAILENQVLDLNELQAQKDQLEYEAMVRNPETAYLVSNEEFDRKLEELGWSPSDIATMSGMYMERYVSNEKWIRDAFREFLEVLFQAYSGHRYHTDVLSDCLVHSGTNSLCYFCVGWVSEYAHTMAHTVYQCVFMVTCG